MGNPISVRSLNAFADELQKQALLGGVGRFLATEAKSIPQLAKRIVNPVKGLREGWRAISPRGSLTAAEIKGIRAAASPEAVAKRGLVGRQWHRLTEQSHLLEDGRIAPRRPVLLQSGPLGIQRLRAAAEELSRRGWTGRGAVTKYLPVGSKSWVTGMPLTAVSGIARAPKSTPTGKGGTLEKALGEAGGAGGWILGSGLGPVTSIGASMGGQSAGSKLGRILDRLRSGATVGQAVSASPAKAVRQTAKIQRY